MTAFPTLDDVRHAMARSEESVSEQNLALLGDKIFLFSDSRRSFIMYGKKGRNWIALGAPIGQVSEAPELIDKFLLSSRKAGCVPAFYAVRKHHLTMFKDAPLKSQKIGEMAVIPLHDFSLEGKDRAKYRQARNRAHREGLSFRVLFPPHDEVLFKRLEDISDDWLKSQTGSEKGFSLGRFDKAVLSTQHIAIVEKGDRIIAFSNLWMSACRQELSLDLMRYEDDVMVGVIDYLIVESALWAKTQGFKIYSLGMAPLAGLDSDDHRNMMSYLCRLAFKHGDTFYNFKGLRQFKNKFNPDWEPVYLLAPRKLHMPGALKNLALLSGGGFKGLIKKAVTNRA